MKVKMLKDAEGSLDGATVGSYAKGQEYDVTDDLGNVFVAEGLAVEVKPKVEQTKQAAGPDENK